MNPIDEQLIIKRISELKRIEPDPLVLRSLKTRVMEEMLRTAVPRAPVFPRIRFAIAPAVVIIAMVGSAAFASQKSLPEDFLYPVKLAGEQVQLEFAKESQKKIALHLGFSGRRLMEAKALSERYSGKRPDVVAGAILRYERQLGEVKALLGTFQASPEARGNDKTLAVVRGIVKSIETNAGLLDAMPSQGTVRGFAGARKVMADTLWVAKNAVVLYAADARSDEEFRAVVLKNLDLLKRRLAPIQLALIWSSDEPAAIEEISSAFAEIKMKLEQSPVPRREIIEKLNQIEEEIIKLEQAFGYSV